MIAVTSFSPIGYDQYGKHFVSTFYEYWPKDVKLLCYWEGEKPEGVRDGFDLLSLEPCASFLDRHRGNLVLQGKVESPQNPWLPSSRRKKYCFRHDAYKFSRKVFATAHAAREAKTDKMFWLDADVVTHKPVTYEALDKFLPGNVSLSFLYRTRHQVEVGFVGFNLDRVDTHDFLRAYERQYVDDLFLTDNTWDDGWQFKLLIDGKFRHLPTYRIPHTSDWQPFDNSMLGQYMTHYKGLRKYDQGGV